MFNGKLKRRVAGLESDAQYLRDKNNELVALIHNVATAAGLVVYYKTATREGWAVSKKEGGNDKVY